MPEFGTPFSGLKEGRKVTPEELIRAIRFMVAAEYEAIQLYMQLAESTDNKLAQEVLKEIDDVFFVVYNQNFLHASNCSSRNGDCQVKGEPTAKSFKLVIPPNNC